MLRKKKIEKMSDKQRETLKTAMTPGMIRENRERSVVPPQRTASEIGTPVTRRKPAEPAELETRSVNVSEGGAHSVSGQTITEEKLALIKNFFLEDYPVVDQADYNSLIDRVNYEQVPIYTQGQIDRRIDRVRKDEKSCRARIDELKKKPYFRPRKNDIL